MVAQEEHLNQADIELCAFLVVKRVNYIVLVGGLMNFKQETKTLFYQLPLVGLAVLAVLWLHHISGSTVLSIAASAIVLMAVDPIPDDLNRLRELEERCRTIEETAQIFIGQNSPEGTITYINRYAEDITGYTREELVGKNILNVLVQDHLKDRFISDIDRVMKGEPIVGTEFPVVTKAGEELPFLWSVARTVGPDGKPNGVVASGIDLSRVKRAEEALRESEELYRTLVDHDLAGVFILQNGKFVFTNRRAEEMAGYTHEEAKQLVAWDVIHPDDRPIVLERATRRLRGEEVQDRYEYRLIMKSGEVRAVEIWATVINYMGSKAILATIIDITERRIAEDERVQREVELERHKRQFYSETITSITQGKLVVMEPDQIEHELEDAQITVNIAEPKDASLSRHLIRQFAESVGLTGMRLDQFLLAVGESSANALKHAGGGTVYSGVRDGMLWFGVADKGPGMDALVLTRAVFRRGFSTKPSLGLGYTFILAYSDRVLLSTSPSGTTVVVMKSIEPLPEVLPIDLSRIPDTW